MEFFVSNVLGRVFWEDFLGGFLFGRIFWEDFLEDCFERNSLFMLICQDLGFCQDFVSIKKEGGQEFRSLEVRLQVHRT